MTSRELNISRFKQNFWLNLLIMFLLSKDFEKFFWIKKTFFGVNSLNQNLSTAVDCCMVSHKFPDESRFFTDWVSQKSIRYQTEEGIEKGWKRWEKEGKKYRPHIFLWTTKQPPCDYPGRGAYMSNLYSARSSVSKFEST